MRIIICCKLQYINTKYIQTNKQIVDIMTKALYVLQIKHLTSWLRLVNVWKGVLRHIMSYYNKMSQADSLKSNWDISLLINTFNKQQETESLLLNPFLCDNLRKT